MPSVVRALLRMASADAVCSGSENPFIRLFILNCAAHSEPHRDDLDKKYLSYNTPHDPAGLARNSGLPGLQKAARPQDEPRSVEV